MKLTEEQIRQIPILYCEEKKEMREIADIFNISVSTVWDYLEKMNISRRHPHIEKGIARFCLICDKKLTKKQKWHQNKTCGDKECIDKLLDKLSIEQINEICNFYENGLSLRKITKKYNVDRKTIIKKLKLKGIKIRHQETNNHLPKYCVICGKELTKIQKQRRNKICSVECKGKFIGKIHIGTHLSKKHKENIGKSLLGKYRGWNKSRHANVHKYCEVCEKELTLQQKQCKGRYCGHVCAALGTTDKKRDKLRKSHIEYMKKGLYKHQDTDIERLIKTELISRNIRYIPQKPLLDITAVDFYLPNHKIVIYCDGEFWHNKKNVKNRDINQDFTLGFNGYKVFRFSGNQIKKSPKRCIDKVERYIENASL